MTTDIIIQARMSSTRLPGKVMMPFGKTTILGSIIDTSTSLVGRENVIVASSNCDSDDPIESYCESLITNIFRGDLENVASRFALISRKRKKNFLRLCADSPLIPKALLNFFLQKSSLMQQLDILTNLHPRTFPKGLSVELVNWQTFNLAFNENIGKHAREHVTSMFYDVPTKFRVGSVSTTQKFPVSSYVVDTAFEYENIITLKQPKIRTQEFTVTFS